MVVACVLVIVAVVLVVLAFVLVVVAMVLMVAVHYQGQVQVGDGYHTLEMDRRE